jgi:uncharacterized protein YjiS (DUF1127 family)
MKKLRRVHRTLVRMLSRTFEYNSIRDELEQLDSFELRDLGISRSDFEAIARGCYRRRNGLDSNCGAPAR